MGHYDCKYCGNYMCNNECEEYQQYNRERISEDMQYQMVKNGAVEYPVYQNLEFNRFVQKAMEKNFTVEHSNGQTVPKYEGPFIRATRQVLQPTADKLKPLPLDWKVIGPGVWALIPKSAGTATEKWK